MLCCTSLVLSSCTAYDQEQITKIITSDAPDKAFKKYTKSKSEQYKKSPEILVKDIKNLDSTLKDFSQIIERIWGKKNAQVASRKKYVKYTNKYQSKAQVDFEKGTITVETIAKNQPLLALKQAIVTTLLTTENPSNTDIFSDKKPVLSGKPYLLGQVLDHENKPIEYQWRASRFADYLIKNQLKQQSSNKHAIHYVQIDMVNKHSQLRKNKYANDVLSAANKYQVKPDLIYAVIETESSFNPFAVSRSNAYGLMQIMQQTAGKDVYQRILKKPGIPSKEILFTARENIHIGTAYLHLLEQQYLKKITNNQSKHYAVISAYNGGAGNVFNTFSKDRNKAVTVINQLTANQVYHKLTNEHPRGETRRYLGKVTSAQKRYLP